MTLANIIKQKAVNLGFDLVGITTADPVDPSHKGAFEQWLASGYAGTMTYLQRHIDKRMDPRLLHKGAQSVIVVGLNFKPAEHAPCGPDPAFGTVAPYAQYVDYHLFIKERLFILAKFIQSQASDSHSFKACVDTVPLAERALAVRAGLGFIGRNHMLIHPQLGPELFLGELVTTLSLEPDAPLDGDCGDCNLCVKACPTGALRTDGQLNASRCINYLTIEYQGPLSDTWAAAMGQCVYGCDACIRCCPYAKQAPACSHSGFTVNNSQRQLNLHDILDMTEKEFSARFSNSPIHRLGLRGLQRNARFILSSRE